MKSMTYEERLNKCNARLSAIIANQSKANEKSATAKSNNTFFDAYSKLISHVLVWKIISKNFDLHLSENDKTLLIECLDIAKDNFSRKAVKLAESFKGKVTKFCSNIEDQWAFYAQTLENDTIDKLTILKVISNDKRVITEILNNFSEMRNWPVTDDKLANFNKSKEKSNKLLNEMQFDSEIEDFLRKVSNHEATFLDLNDNIISWIRKEGLEKNISINIKTTMH